MTWDEDTEFYDPEQEEQARYDETYTTTLTEQLKSVEDEDDRESIFHELRQLRYNPSNQPAQDAQLNFLKAKNAANQKRRRLSGAATSWQSIAYPRHSSRS